MAVSPFDRLRSGRSRIDEKFMGSTASPIITQKPNCCVSQKSCVKEHARASVAPATSSKSPFHIYSGDSQLVLSPDRQLSFTLLYDSLLLGGAPTLRAVVTI